jgi:hypothetical protein
MREKPNFAEHTEVVMLARKAGKCWKLAGQPVFESEGEEGLTTATKV